MATAQDSRIVGTIVDERGLPIAGAQVTVSDGQNVVHSNSDGRFFLLAAPGQYRLRATRVGFSPDSASVQVHPAGSALVSLRLTAIAYQIQGQVISASRRVERVTDAPAIVMSFAPSQIENRLGNSYFPVLKDVVGLNVAHGGATNALINGRGFAKLWLTRALTLEDGRISLLPETGSPLGESTTMSRIDIAGAEVLVGPGSGLYGANAVDGVIALRTKDPRSFPGQTTELSFGSRNYRDVQVRMADAPGPWGYKFVAGYQGMREWPDSLFYPRPGGGEPVLEDTPLDTDISRFNASLSRYFDDGGRIEMSVGASDRTGLRPTALGRQRIRNHTYDHYQIQYVRPRWFAQLYQTHSNTGDTYFLFTEADRRARFPNISIDSARSLAAFELDGRVGAAELQNNFVISSLLQTGIRAVDSTYFVWGAQYRRDRISSYGRIYRDRLTGEPLHYSLPGIYGHAEIPVTASLRLVLGGRYDEHNLFPAQYSPRAALLVRRGDQRVRIAFNSAYAVPPTVALSTYNPGVIVNGTTYAVLDGLEIRNSSGAIVNTIPAIRPEINRTWELGYKGTFGMRLSVDVTAYRSRSADFVSNLVRVADPYAASPTRAYNSRTGALVADSSGRPLITLTYFNLGTGYFDGVDAIVRHQFNERVATSATLSVTRLDTIETRPTDPVDAAGFNTSPTRASLSLEAVDTPKDLTTRMSIRYANGYEFRTGIDNGHVPTFATLDLSGSYRIANLATTILLQVQNLAACVSGTTTRPPNGVAGPSRHLYTPKRDCGFGVRHRELLNMPAIGTMIFVGARRDWR
jgi:iron complex outermembrane receptor protein